jgi:hypothetical protein
MTWRLSQVGGMCPTPQKGRFCETGIRRGVCIVLYNWYRLFRESLGGRFLGLLIPSYFSTFEKKISSGFKDIRVLLISKCAFELHRLY